MGRARTRSLPWTRAFARPTVLWMAVRTDIEQALRRLAPQLPKHEFGVVLDHALDSPGLRSATPEAAAWLSLVAYVRHAITDYDDLLAEGYDRDSARHFVMDHMQAALTRWGVRRRLASDE